MEQVQALAPARLRAARPLAVPSAWVDAGCDAEGLWGRCVGQGREPYDVAVDHQRLRFRCTCPSRVHPCKHAVALLVWWAEGGLGSGRRPPSVSEWLEVSVEAASARGASSAPGGGRPTSPEPPTRPRREPSDRRTTERRHRVRAGLRELDRWITDRLRTGVAAPALARYTTWDELAARLVDAQAGGLANRVRRIGGVVGARSGWHEHVLAEVGVLHLLAQAGTRQDQLPDDLADGVAAAIGWTVRHADVLASVPETDTWRVAGRSDVVEDRITVRRTWLHGDQHGWALLLAFAAHGQALDDTWEVGTAFEADLHRYPGTVRLRALVGRVHRPPWSAPGALCPAASLAAVCDDVGGALAAEPWLERVPFAARVRVGSQGGRWWLHDHTGGLPLVDAAPALAVLLASTATEPVTVVCEWTPAGVVPLAVHGSDRAIDIGPRGSVGRTGAM